MEQLKDIKYWRKNAEEDYGKVPISVLRYITELEDNNRKESKKWVSYFLLGFAITSVIWCTLFVFIIGKII